jgi:hypothetical protein
MTRTLVLMAVVNVLFATGLWLLGVPIDWTSWKTALGIGLVSIASVLAGGNLHRPKATGPL